MDKTFSYDEESEEKYFEKIEAKMEPEELDSLRNRYDAGWDEPRTGEKLKLIVENTQGLIDKRCLQ